MCNCIYAFCRFSFPVVDIQSCIQTAVRLFQATPISAYMREYQVGSIHSENIPPEAVSPFSRLFVYFGLSCENPNAFSMEFNLCT